jgi:hypothetical protein
MSMAPLRQLGARIDLTLRALALQTLAILVANQGAVMPTLVMASIAISMSLLKSRCPARLA